MCHNLHVIQIIISERTVLWYMAFWGFGMNFMLRMNLNIAIVSMVRQTTKPNNDELLNNEHYDNKSTLNTSFLVHTEINDVSITTFINVVHCMIVMIDYAIMACNRHYNKLKNRHKELGGKTTKIIINKTNSYYRFMNIYIFNSRYLILDCTYHTN